MTGGGARAGRGKPAGEDDEPAISISASATTPSVSSVLIAMGHLSDPSNTFWEVFLRPAHGTSWVLSTPPGVASNGGLVAAVPQVGPLTVGFLISADLRFSPLAQSSDGGETWSPGELPSPLTSTPDALAVGPRGEVLALVGKADQSILTSPGKLSHWQTFSSTKTLEHYTSTCALEEVTAVTLNAASQPLLGLECGRSSTIGVLAPIGSSSAQQSGWRNIGPSLNQLGGQTSVIRLEATAHGPAGLGQVKMGKRTSLVAFWGEGSTDQWSGPTLSSVPAGWTVKATATGGGTGQGFAVLLGSDDRRRVEVIAGPGGSWATLPTAPQGASGVSVIGAEVDAFVVTGSRLAIWTWTPGAASWHRTALINVPVPYGSSS
jgi:hypothetical protein